MPVSFCDGRRRIVSVARGEAAAIRETRDEEGRKKPPMEELMVLLISELKADRWIVDGPL